MPLQAQSSSCLLQMKKSITWVHFPSHVTTKKLKLRSIWSQIILVPLKANVVKLGFIVPHAWPLWSYAPQAHIAQWVVSIRHVYVEIVRFRPPFEPAKVQCSPPKIRSKWKLIRTFNGDHMRPEIVVLGFTMNGHLCTHIISTSNSLCTVTKYCLAPCNQQKNYH